MNYLKNELILEMLKVAPRYKKKATTLLRLPLKEELGKQLVTYVKGVDGQLIREASSMIYPNKVIARNEVQIGTIEGVPIFNEWTMDTITVAKNYGENTLSKLTCEFQAHQKQATVKAIELTQEILDMLGIKESFLAIDVTWSVHPMIANIGSYLTAEGYCISKEDMKSYMRI